MNPFTRTAQYNAPIYFDGTNYVAEPYAYGLKAFTLGSGGQTISTNAFLVDNPGNINVTAYGVVNSNDLYVTIINKTFDDVGSATAEVAIPAPGGFKVQSARYMVLSGGTNAGASGVATMHGACLVGAEIPNNGSSWAGKWTRLAVSAGGVSLSVLPTTAVVIDLQNYPLLSVGSPPLDAKGFHFSAFAPAGSNLIVQVSTNLVKWTPVYTNSGSFQFSDPNATIAPCRFFGLVMP